MKKILTIVFMALAVPCALALNLKVEAESDIDIENEKEFSVKILETAKFKDGTEFPENTILHSQIIKYVPAKRGKQDAYIVLKPISIDHGMIATLLEEKDIEGQIGGFKIIDKEKIKQKGLEKGITTGVQIGLKAAGATVPGVGQLYEGAKGLIKPEEGKSRFQSAANNIYESTPFSFISKGDDITISKGDKLVLKLYHSDIPKWRIRKRQK